MSIEDELDLLRAVMRGCRANTFMRHVLLRIYFDNGLADAMACARAWMPARISTT